MIPYPYSMVDMGGIDLAEANGTVVEGLYAKIVEAVNACGDVVLYNWKFAGIEIAPQHTSILLGDPIIINGAVQVTEQDEVTVPGINPEPPPPPTILPLNVNENGEYSADDYDADGFDPVNVLLPPPVTTSLEVTQNGIYTPPSGVVGYSSVTVDVDGGGTIAEPDLPEGYQKLEYLINNTGTTSASMSLSLAIGDILVFKVREAAEGSGVGPVVGQYNWNVNVGSGSITPYGNYSQKKNDWSQVDNIKTLDSRISFTGTYSGTFWYGAWRGGSYSIVQNCRLYPLYVLDVDNSSVYSALLKLKAALIPCYRVSDGVNSFYDAVSDTFLTVSGSFSRGPEVN